MNFQSTRDLPAITLCVFALFAIPAFPRVARAGASADSPKAVCDQLARAARKDDFQAFQALSTGWTSQMASGHGASSPPQGGATTPGKAESELHSVHQSHLGQLKDLRCDAEHIADDHAVVEAESQGRKRLIPFIEVKGHWKFDARTYLSFYPMHH